MSLFPPKPIPESLWQGALGQYPFLAHRPAPDLAKLRLLSSHFLKQKEFHGANGLVITDRIALAIAAQACLPILHLAPDNKALKWYADFVGIVVHPGEMVARRQTQDGVGVHHSYAEVIAGEAMHRGPVTLNWHDVRRAGAHAVNGSNLVIHEFAHKLDMQDGAANGCPPLPAHFMGTSSPRAAKQIWRNTLQAEYDKLCDQVALHQRFGADAPWLDAYAATAPAEFFAVACEAYFVNRVFFSRDFAALVPLFDGFFYRQ